MSNTPTPAPPDMDELFCPSCGSRNLETETREQWIENTYDEVAEAGAEYDKAFNATGAVAIGCNDCGLESGYVGFPTIRELFDPGGKKFTASDIDVGRIVRWAFSAATDEQRRTP